MLSSWPALRGAWPTPKCSKHKTLGVCFSDLWCKLYDTANVLCMPAWWESTQSSNPEIQTQTKKHQKQTEMIEKLVPLLLPSIDQDQLRCFMLLRAKLPMLIAKRTESHHLKPQKKKDDHKQTYHYNQIVLAVCRFVCHFVRLYLYIRIQSSHFITRWPGM